MRVGKASTYSILFFLIFILGVVFVVTYINLSLNKNTEIIPVEPRPSSHTIASSFEE